MGEFPEDEQLQKFKELDSLRRELYHLGLWEECKAKAREIHAKYPEEYQHCMLYHSLCGGVWRNTSGIFRFSEW